MVLQNIVCDVEEINGDYVNEAIVSSFVPDLNSICTLHPTGLAPCLHVL